MVVDEAGEVVVSVVVVVGILGERVRSAGMARVFVRGEGGMQLVAMYLGSMEGDKSNEGKFNVCEWP